MKRSLWIPLIAALLLSLTACEAPTGTNVTTTTDSQTVVTTTVPPETTPTDTTTAAPVTEATDGVTTTTTTAVTTTTTTTIVEPTGTVARIGDAKAKEIALQHAGVTAAEISRYQIELDTKEQEYEIEFYVGAVEYDYEIAAADGTIRKAERGDVNLLTTTTYQSPATVSLIGDAKAKEIALQHAGVTAAEISRYQIELDTKEQEYEIEFYVGTVEYDYEIDAYSGTVLKAERDTD